MHSLEVLLLWGGYTPPSKGFSITSSVDLEVSTHGGAAFISSLWSSSHSIVSCSIILDSATKSAPKGGDVIAVLSFIVFRSFAVRGRLASTRSAISS